MATKVSYTKAVNKMRALGNVLKRPLRDVLDSGAKTVALSCARSTVPFGTGESAKLAGEKAVARDIARVYAQPGKAYEDIITTSQAAFWKNFKDGNYHVAQEILDGRGNRLRGVRLERFDGGAAHRAARNSSTGRVAQSRPSMIVTNPEALQRYIERVKRNVGTAKGGWADVARALGSTPRGLRTEGDITANWITRNGRGYGKAIQGGSNENPTMRIINSIPYADHALSGSAKSEAIRIGHERMLRNLEIAVKQETRKLRSAA